MRTSSSHALPSWLSASVLLAVLASGYAPASAEARPAHTIKVGTVAPDRSSWVESLRAIDAEVRQRTDGAVGLRIYPGGVQGNEEAMLRKIRVGQLQAGGFAGTGGSQILPDILALEMPFQFEDYDEVNYVLDRTRDFYREQFERRGFVLLGWTDIGFVYLFSKHPIAGAGDIESLKVWRLHGEPITRVLFKKAGVTSVPLAIPDVLLGLQTKLVEVVYASPAAAIVLQWFTRVGYYTDLPINYTMGPFLIERGAFAQLTPEHQAILREVSERHLLNQRRRSRKDNEEALQVMEREGLTRVTPEAAGIATFHELVRQSIPELVGEAFTTEAYDLIQHHLAEYRSGDQKATGP